MTTTHTSSPPTPIPTKGRTLAVAVLIFAMFIDLMDVTIVNVALPAMRTDLWATPSQLEWIVGGYTLAFAAALITGARLGDRFGRRTVFITGITGFTLASLAASLVDSGDHLVWARVAQGLFGGVMVPQLLSTVQTLYRPKERGPILAVVGMLTGLAAVIGPVLGGFLVTHNIFEVLGVENGWRAIFWINIPIGIAIIVAAFAFVPNTRADFEPVDWLGNILAIAAVLLLIYPLVEGQTLGWPWWLLTMLCAAPVMLAGFCLHQRRRRERLGTSLIPLSLFTIRSFNAGIITIVAMSGGVIGYFLILMLYLQGTLGFSALAAGGATLPFSIGAFVGSAASTPLVARFGRWVPMVGALAALGATEWTARVIDGGGAALSAWDLLGPMTLGGVGLGLVMPPLLGFTLANIGKADAGAASGCFSTFQQFGNALAVALVGMAYFSSGYQQAHWVVAAFFAATTLGIALLPARPVTDEV